MFCRLSLGPIFYCFGRVLGGLGSIFGRFGGSWGAFGGSWEGSWRLLGGLGRLLGRLGPSWVVKGHFGASRVGCTAAFGPPKEGQDEAKIGPRRDQNR